MKPSVHGILPAELELATVSSSVTLLPGESRACGVPESDKIHGIQAPAESDELRRLRQELESLRNREVERAQDLEKKSH